MAVPQENLFFAGFSAKRAARLLPYPAVRRAAFRFGDEPRSVLLS